MVNYSIIIVTYNNQQTIKECLDSIIKNSHDHEIIVVDNDSEDKTASIVKKYTNISLIKNSENLGFSKANNIGAKQAKGEFLIFLNPDTKITEKNSLQKLCQI